MQSIRKCLLKHLSVGVPNKKIYLEYPKQVETVIRQLCTSTTSHGQITTRIISLVSKFNNIDATKVSETADFQKDLSLDSLDRVELVMALEQEFSIEIPDDKADKLTCCADVANYILSQAQHQTQ